MKKEDWSVIRVMRNARHDWMNQIQLIKGYMALGKLDEAERAIDATIIQARQEAHLCNLQLPRFAEMLLTFNWERHSFRLDYEVLQCELKTKPNDDCLTNWVSQLFDMLESQIERYADNHLYLSIQGEETDLRFFFDFSGIIIDERQCKQKIEKLLNIPCVRKWEMHGYCKEEMLFEVTI